MPVPSHASNSGPPTTKYSDLFGDEVSIIWIRAETCSRNKAKMMGAAELGCDYIDVTCRQVDGYVETRDGDPWLTTGDCAWHPERERWWEVELVERPVGRYSRAEAVR